MTHYQCGLDGTPSIVHKTRLLKKIWYLPQINLSPTSASAVAETMRRTLRTASEGQKEHISVTCDLALVKLAMKIQAEEKPTFDRLFISLGSFHVEMIFSSAMGKIIEQSGGPHILDECTILAKGSITSLLRGKSF